MWNIFLNNKLFKKGQICSPCCEDWTRAQYVPLSDKSTGVTVCSQCIYEWEPSSPSCVLNRASVYQLVVQRVLWHWTWPESSLLNRVWSQHGPVCVKRTLLQWERGQSGNMLGLLSLATAIQWRPLYFCWSHRYVTWSWCGSDSIPATSTFLWYAACHSWLILSQPHDRAYPPHAHGLLTGTTFLDMHRNKLFAWCFSSLETGCGYGSTLRHSFSDNMHRISQDAALS